ncbi:MAG: hypothetical protein J6B81_01720 [Spirochaetaceae bacterium]|nr:hypothetical protein [Spirochaetaceae bacterium]
MFLACNPAKDSKKEIENASLIEPELVTDSDMMALQGVYNFPEPKRRIAVLFGYGYNDEAFIAKTMQLISSSFGLADNGGTVIPFVFPDDFKRGSAARISLLSGMLSESGAEGLILVGAPEGTHGALAKMKESADEGSIVFPIFSLLPQDDILGMEANCDLVLEYRPFSSTEDGFAEESVAYTQNVPELIQRALYYMSMIPIENNGGLNQDISELMVHARQLVGSSWVVSQYVDPETGISAQNHFVIEQRPQTNE